MLRWLIAVATSIGLACPVAAADLEKLLRVAMSCSAYAMIRTSEFPETIKVYEEKKPATTALEAERARTGMTWTNRVYYSANFLGAETYRQIYGRYPTNGEIEEAKGTWMKILNDATDTQREAIHANCRILYQDADKYCGKSRCVEIP
jgi:hypothetical protein